MKFYHLLFISLFLTSCGGPRAVYDYDETAGFSNISTYQIFPELETGMNQLDEQRLINILSEQLAQRGFTTSEDPQIFVNFYSTEYQTPSRNSVGIGVGGSGRNVGVGISGGIPIGGPEVYRKITFDFIDAQKDVLIWQAVVEGKFDNNMPPEKRADKLQTMVQEALKGYPPNK